MWIRYIILFFTSASLAYGASALDSITKKVGDFITESPEVPQKEALHAILNRLVRSGL